MGAKKRGGEKNGPSRQLPRGRELPVKDSNLDRLGQNQVSYH